MSTLEFLALLVSGIVLGLIVLLAILDHIRDRRYVQQQRDLEASLRADRRQRMQSARSGSP